MMQNYFLAVIVAIPLSVFPQIVPSALAQTNPSLAQQPSLSSFNIGGITSTSTEAQVRARLGAPQQIKTAYWECCGNIKIFRYGRTTVQLIDDAQGKTFSVFAVSTQDPRYATASGIKVGDRRAQVLARYGKPSQIEKQGRRDVLSYMADALATSLNFVVEGDRIVEINFMQQLN
jgi:hypothetical protein